MAHYRLHPNSSDLNTATIKHQYYDTEVYDEYVREENREGGKQNNFVRMGLKTEVLYNPERDENGKAIDGSGKGAAQSAPVAPKADKTSLPIREITVNEIVFEVFQNSAKTLYTAKQKDGGALTAEGKTLVLLNEDLKKVTDI